MSEPGYWRQLGYAWRSMFQEYRHQPWYEWIAAILVLIFILPLLLWLIRRAEARRQ